MSPIRIAIVSDPAEVERLWKLLSPHNTIYDEWDFRACFLKRHPTHTLHCVVGTEGDTPVAMLPLQKNDQGLIEFLGGDFMEDNRVLVSPGHEEAIPLLFDPIQSKATVRSILAEGRPFLQQLPLDFPKYSYSLEGCATLMDFLVKTFPSNRRYSRRKIIKDIEQLNLKIELNRLEDLSLLERFNIETFQDESVFRVDPAMSAIFRDFCDLPYSPLIHSFVIDGKTQAVSLSLIHKKTYLFMLPGSNKDEISNLGNYVILHNLKTAIEKGCSVFDAGRHDCNWKEQWHLDKTEEHRFDHD